MNPSLKFFAAMKSSWCISPMACRTRLICPASASSFPSLRFTKASSSRRKMMLSCFRFRVFRGLSCLSRPEKSPSRSRCACADELFDLFGGVAGHALHGGEVVDAGGGDGLDRAELANERFFALGA